MHRRWREREPALAGDDAGSTSSTSGGRASDRCLTPSRSRAGAELARRRGDGAAGDRRRAAALRRPRAWSSPRAPAWRRLFALVPRRRRGRSTLQWNGAAVRSRARCAPTPRALRDGGADAAMLLPNSFASAWLVRQRGRAGALGLRDATARAPLLTRAGRRPARQPCIRARTTSTSTRELGIASGPLEPRADVPRRRSSTPRARCWPRAAGTATRPLVVLAPGAAYGTAKRWLPAHFAALVVDARRRARRARACWSAAAPTRATTRAGARAVAARRAAARHRSRRRDDARRCWPACSRWRAPASRTIPARCTWRRRSACRVVALFGPTREHETAPLARAARPAEVLTHPRVVPSLHAARVPDRSPLHDRPRRRRGCWPPWLTPMSGRRELTPAGGVPRSRRHAHRGARLLDRLELLELFPWTADAIRLLNRAGFADGRHHQPVGDRPRHHRRAVPARRCTTTLDARLARAGARIDRYYFCPHHPDAELPSVSPGVPLPQAGPGHDRAGVPRAGARSRALVHGRRPAGSTSRAATRRARGDAGAHRPRRARSEAPPGPARAPMLSSTI